MKSDNIYIIHHNDMDGITAAGIMYMYFCIRNESNESKIKTFEIDYIVDLHDLIDLDDLHDGDHLVFVDYSFSNIKNIEFLKALVTKPVKLFWFDHHETSLSVLKDLPDSINLNQDIIIDMNRCGAKIAYDWCINHEKIFTGGWFYRLKYFVDYVDRYDRWVFDPKDRYDYAREFNLGFGTLDITPQTFEDKIGDLGCDMNDAIKEIVSRGLAIRKYLNTKNSKLIANNSFEFTINYFGKVINILAVNARGNSEVFGNKINEYDAVCLFNTDGSVWTYSLYSNKEDVNCGEICKYLGSLDELGGGGHKGAAGFLTMDNIIYSGAEINMLIEQDNDFSIDII